MNIIFSIVLLVVGILFVVKSADWFLGAAEKIGEAFRLPQFVMGVVLVGFGTSLPELSTSIAAISSGEHTVTLANVIGSNIANIFLIFGVSTFLLGTIRFNKDLIDLDMPFLAGITLLFSYLIIDGELSQVDAALLIVGFFGYMLYSMAYRDETDHHKGMVRLLRSVIFSKKTKTTKQTSTQSVPLVTWGVLVASIVILAVASNVTISSMLAIVEEIGIGVGVLSFFALAIGTSLPELIVSIKSLRQGKSDIVIGNIVGSCIFNILMIGGIIGAVHAQYIDMTIAPWAIGGLIISMFMMVISAMSRRIHIWEGFAFLLLYVAIATKVMGV